MTSTYTKKFEAIGTHWHVEFAFDPRETDAELLMAQLHKRIDQFDRTYSRFRIDSLVTEMAHTPGTYLMPEDAEPLLMLYQELYAVTHGSFTPLIGSALVEAGYDAQYSLTPKKMHAVPRMEQVLTYEAPYLTSLERIVLDVGAAGKGYLIDILGEILKDNGALSYVIDAGGDIAVYAENNTLSHIALEHPEDTTQAVGVATISNQSLCGSAGHRRAWGSFHHIIDPHTLQSPKEIIATWVVAKTTMLADALATCLYLVPASSLATHYSFEYLVMHADSSIEKSGNFPAEVFTN